MGNIVKVFIMVFVILLVSMLLGMYQIQNDQDVQVDLIYFAEPVVMSVARFGMIFFFAGVLVGIALCVMIMLVLAFELKGARREAKKVAKELSKLRERNLKEST